MLFHGQFHKVKHKKVRPALDMDPRVYFQQR